MEAPVLAFHPSLAAAFEARSLVVVPGAISPEIAGLWRREARDAVAGGVTAIDRDAHLDPLSYDVLPGEVVRRRAPSLAAFYDAPSTRDWVRLVTGAESIARSGDARSAINVNGLSRPGHRYRAHFDAVPFSMLLFLTDAAPEDGGFLEVSTSIAPDPPVWEQVLPRAGTIVLMDGTRRLHRVTPILRVCERLSVPMVFPTDDASHRPAGLDDYLYGPER